MHSARTSPMPFSTPPPCGTIGSLQYRWAVQHARGESVGGDALFLEGDRRDGRAMFLLVDAEGKGAHAAQIVEVIDAQLRSFATLRNRQPGELLSDLHSRLGPIWAIQGVTERFVGAYAILVDSTCGSVEVACAGMPDPIRVSTQRGSSVIEIPQSVWLGVSLERRPVYPVTEITIDRGEGLWFCSDGATDVCPPNAGRRACLGSAGLGRLVESIVRDPGECDVLPILFEELARIAQHEWAQDDTIVLYMRHVERSCLGSPPLLTAGRPNSDKATTESRSSVNLKPGKLDRQIR